MLETKHATDKAPYAIAIMVGMMLLMTFQIQPAVTAVLLAAVAMMLTGCLTMEDAYTSMNWESIILIAAMLPMATALEKTGGVDAISNALIGSLGSSGPLIFLAGLFVLTSVLSQVIPNTATTVLITPIAFQLAISLGVSPYTFRLFWISGGHPFQLPGRHHCHRTKMDDKTKIDGENRPFSSIFVKRQSQSAYDPMKSS